MVSLFARATRRVSVTHIRHVAAVPPRAATGLVGRVYRQMEADFGMVAPPIMLHAPAPENLAACWSILRETLLVPGLVSREDKEAVAAAVSLSNQCPYCVDVHGTALLGLAPGADARSVAADRIDGVAEPRLRELTRWARGSRPDAPFPPELAPELAGVAVTFHYINRMVNIFLCESPFPPVPATVLGVIRRGATRIMRGMASRRATPGGSAELLPDAPLPPDLGWAAGAPHIATAFARASAAIEAGGTRAVPPRVRQLVLTRLADGTGTPPGISSREWLDPAVADLPEIERPAGRLALLAALASYRVTDALIDEFRSAGNDDAAIVELMSWASLTAARQIGAGLVMTSEGYGRTS
ncbi:MAG TPA: carboxymuconolactone decarboxylase family protein [Micromonosporaceae bacterium]|nr:carboxymuconolactone decarboxylase family protein [Micromonosporaceae bacterium]